MNKKLLGLIILLIGFVWPIHAQEINFKLSGNALELYQDNFELVEVIDVRPNKPSIGKIYTAPNQTVTSKIEGGMEKGLQQFYENSLPSNSSQRPVQMRVLEFSVAEKKQSAGMVSGEVKLKFGYYLKGKNDPVHLLNYESGMNYRRSISHTDLVSQVLNQGITKSIQYFNDWISSHADTDRRLAKAVRLELVEKTRKSGNDTVFYNKERPITWQDFIHKPNEKSRFNAAIFTSLALEVKPKVEAGTVILPLEVKVYMVPDSSWVKGPNDYSLNHEQRHFDVTRIVANRLISRLKSMDLTPDNYDALLNEAYSESNREMDRLQKIYDAQTQHGINTDAQSHWNGIIDQALDGNMEGIEAELAKGRLADVAH